MKPEIVEIPSWRYKTIVVIKRQQQTTTSNKQTLDSVLAWCRVQNIQFQHITQA